MSTLVYFCHFGKEQHGDLMVTAVTALRNVGNYQGDIMIYSDDPARAVNLIRRMPGREKIGLLTNSGNRGLFTRYSAGYFLSRDYAHIYDNFIYMDNDVMVSRDFTAFIDSIEKSDKEMFCYTNEFYVEFDKNRQRPFNPLSVAYPPNYTGSLLTVHPAIFTFKATDNNRDMFLSIREVRDTTAEYRYNLNYDTALFSYKLFRRLNEIDYTTIKPMVNMCNKDTRKNTELGEDQLFTRFDGFTNLIEKNTAARRFVAGLIPSDVVGDTNDD